MSAFRILVTGWRYWPKEDSGVIDKALHAYAFAALGEGYEVVVVDGQCEYGGADEWAYQWVLKQDTPLITPERHPAERDPRTHRILGTQRNLRMVELGADVCLAFPGPNPSPRSGTRHCMKLAMKVGIPTVTNTYGHEFTLLPTLDGTRTFP